MNVSDDDEGQAGLSQSHQTPPYGGVRISGG